MDENYTEDIKEAVRSNMEYLEDETVEGFISFLEAVGENLYEGELLEKLASAIRDAVDGV